MSVYLELLPHDSNQSGLDGSFMINKSSSFFTRLVRSLKQKYLCFQIEKSIELNSGLHEKLQ